MGLNLSRRSVLMAGGASLAGGLIPAALAAEAPIKIGLQAHLTGIGASYGVGRWLPIGRPVSPRSRETAQALMTRLFAQRPPPSYSPFRRASGPWRSFPCGGPVYTIKFPDQALRRAGQAHMAGSCAIDPLPPRWRKGRGWRCGNGGAARALLGAGALQSPSS